MSVTRTAAVLLAAAFHLAPTASAAPDEGDVRDTLVTANRILAMEGLVGPFGHVSVRADAGLTSRR